ncbi:MAG: GDSL-type esterase/lipase family protein [Phycisphaerales bacterium]
MARHVAVWILPVLLLPALPGCATRALPPVIRTEPAGAAPWYEPEIAAFEAADRAAPPAPGQVLFVGSSSIRMWKTLPDDMSPVPVLNRGFGGSKTFDVLAVFDRIVGPYRPTVIVYYCGDNDLGTDNQDAARAAEGFIQFDRRVRRLLPDAAVLYIAIKPSPARWSNWPAMARANMIVRDYCDATPGATFLDIEPPMLSPEARPDPSLFQADGLHLNPAGYAAWTRVVRPAVVRAYSRRAR